MTARRVERSPWLPAPGWWGSLAAVLASGLLIHWAIGAGLLAWLLAQRYRPFDFVVAFLILVAGAIFIQNEMGGLTYQLSYLTVGVLMMIALYLLTMGQNAVSIPRTSMTLALVLFLGLSLVNMVRGFVLGHPAKFLLLESYPLLALGCTFLVANAFQPQRDLRLAMVGLVAIGFAIGTRGYVTFLTVRLHTVSEYDVATPGIVAILLVNLALRSKSWREALVWELLSIPLFIHQFLTFGRGLWTGCIAGLAVSFLIYARPGREFRARGRRAGLVFGTIIVLGVLGAAVAATAFQRTSILAEAGQRLFSIGSTKVGYGTRSNLIRLWEYATALRHIRQSPWFGHGIGYMFVVMDPFANKTADQPYVHQNYLLVLLKQGIVGLILFVWMLGAATILGIRESWRAAGAWESAWFATSAATTCFLAVLSLSNFPFMRANEMFLLALLWGGSMAMANHGRITFRWKGGDVIRAPTE